MHRIFTNENDNSDVTVNKIMCRTTTRQVIKWVLEYSPKTGSNN